ncbi:hypothetical protein PV10_07945 [Exophiala mesophila]|uniref:Glycosyl transferase family 25 domain-containing protein n=1 Tax=Exophiala mesophila TaxID=212818 RepID=A0A0D1ZN71_EXOME|nr:uncharacterized protein PV10_07945 [Exophiala mesophila]KIV88243.1 hypothetical protein PV10_07945 [Exophiala mesophila]
MSDASTTFASLMAITKRRGLVGVVICFGLLMLLFQRADSVPTVTRYALGRSHHEDVYNTTLGFQKVFTISLQERTDKKDLSTLAASFAGFQVEYLPGVRPDDIADQAIPSNWDTGQRNPGALGCWRAHMNVLQKIISEGIQSALITEDDADWSPFLKDQLFEIATGSRALQNSPDSTPSPYGHNWDFLWLGHNRVGPTDSKQEFWVIENDFTVPPPSHRNSRWRQTHVPDEVTHNDTRLFFRAYAGMCLYGYAVTYEGARKMLSSMSVQPRNQPVDQSVSDMCRGKMAKGFDCYAVWPPLMSTHRAAGYTSQDSDINPHEKGDWHDEYTFDIPFSTMINIPRLVDGASSIVSQWNDTEIQEVPWDPSARRSPTGYLKQFHLGSLPATAKLNGEKIVAP